MPQRLKKSEFIKDHNSFQDPPMIIPPSIERFYSWYGSDVNWIPPIRMTFNKRINESIWKVKWESIGYDVYSRTSARNWKLQILLFDWIRNLFKQDISYLLFDGRFFEIFVHVPVITKENSMDLLKLLPLPVLLTKEQDSEHFCTILIRRTRYSEFL